MDVVLSTVFPKGPTLFQLDGKRLQLLQPLDRDADNLSHMVFQVILLSKSFSLIIKNLLISAFLKETTLFTEDEE